MRTLQIEIARKGVHTLIAGCFAFVAGYVSKELVIGGAFALFLFFTLLRIVRVQTSMHGVMRATFGELFFALGIIGAAYIALPDITLFQLSMAILALADPAAALIGMRYGKHVYHVFDEKRSYEGSLVCAILSLGILLFFGIPFSLALFVALILTGIEAVSLRGSDNLFLPMSTILLLNLFLG